MLKPWLNAVAGVVRSQEKSFQTEAKNIINTQQTDLQ